MMLPTGECLKEAIERGDFEQATILIEAFGKAVACELRSADSAEKRVAVANDASSFLQDRLHLARVMRAHIASQLSLVSRLSSYGTSAPVRSTWTFEG